MLKYYYFVDSHSRDRRFVRDRLMGMQTFCERWVDGYADVSCEIG